MHIIYVGNIHLEGMICMGKKIFRGKQMEILEYIKKYVHSNNMSPSVTEISKAVGLKVSTVQSHLHDLEEAGYIRKTSSKARSIELLCDPLYRYMRDNVAVPIVGKEAVGQSAFNEEDCEEYFPLPKKMLPKGKKLYMMKADEDSMSGVGINNGDLVIVERAASASNGDIVAARIGDEVTVKKFYKKSVGVAELHPENPSYPILRPEKFDIAGKVIGCIHMYT